jgi:hypothetical protein
MYPTFKNGEKLEKFPKIPPGMLKIWRSEDDFEF